MEVRSIDIHGTEIFAGWEGNHSMRSTGILLRRYYCTVLLPPPSIFRQSMDTAVYVFYLM